MAFKEKIVPNWRGTPREFEPIERERRDTEPQLTAEERERAYQHARSHRISLSEAIKELFWE